MEEISTQEPQTRFERLTELSGRTKLIVIRIIFRCFVTSVVTVKISVIMRTVLTSVISYKVRAVRRRIVRRTHRIIYIVYIVPHIVHVICFDFAGS